MKAFEKFKNMISAPLEDFEEDDFDEEEDEVREDIPRATRRPQTGKGYQQRTVDAGHDFSTFEPTPKERQRNTQRTAPVTHNGKVVDIHTTAKLQVVLTKPKKFTEACDIAENLNEKRTVVLNLEAIEKGESRRLLDFLCGVAFANGGEVKKIANHTFIITPYNVDVMGDLLYELENNGVFFQ